MWQRPRPGDMLSPSRMKALLERAMQTCDVAIVDSASLSRCADTRILAKEIVEVSLVLQPEASKLLGLMKDSRQMLEAIGARVSGFALNKVLLKECESLSLSVVKKSQVQS